MQGRSQEGKVLCNDLLRKDAVKMRREKRIGDHNQIAVSVLAMVPMMMMMVCGDGDDDGGEDGSKV